MGSPKSITTENPEPPRRQNGVGPRGTPTAATDVADATYSDEPPSRVRWLSEAPLTGVLGEMALYYGACWRHHRSVDAGSRQR